MPDLVTGLLPLPRNSFKIISLRRECEAERGKGERAVQDCKLIDHVTIEPMQVF